MSSLAAVCADGYYWKPEDENVDYWLKWGEKKEEKDYHKSRFEMPFNVWCLHCNCKIGKGVRFNSLKSEIGKYLSTPIYKFTMTCR